MLASMGTADGAPERKDGALKYASLFIFMVGTVGSSVLTKRATYAANFPVALTQLTALVGAVVYPLMVAVAVAMGWVKIPQLTLPWWKPAAIAVLFVLHHSCLNAGAGGAAVPGVMIGVLVKFVIPFSMLFNMPKATLGVRYGVWHWLSFCVVMAGIAVTVRMGGIPLAPNAVFQMVLIALSTIPLAAAFTLIEITLTIFHKELLAVALWAWICLCQSLASLALLPLSSWLSGVQLNDMLPNLDAGMVCYLRGVNTPANEAHLDCGEAAKCWWLSLLFAFLMNIGMCLSTRYGGATLMWFVRAFTVPLGAVCFAQTALMGSHAVPMTLAQVAGVLVVFAGVLGFNAVEPAQGRRRVQCDEGKSHKEKLLDSHA